MTAEGIDESIRAIERAAGTLATTSVARMDEVLPWFRELPADQRSWVMLVAQAGVRAFVAWLRDTYANRGRGGEDIRPDLLRTQELADEIFEAAPRTLARSISLQQTVQLIEVTIDVVEERVASLAAPGQEAAVTEAILRFSREVAFSAARVYARAAESRGSWDARLQAQLVDAVVRADAPEELASRAAALGWDDRSPVAVAVGSSPGGDAAAVLYTVHRLARRMGLDVIGGVQGSTLVLVLGGAADPLAATEKLVAAFGDGPVTVGPAVPTLAEATESARAALAALRAAEPGSGFQLAWARAFAACARRPSDLAVVRSWLSGDDVPDGLTVDTDLRWSLLSTLVAHGAADPAEIDAELERDRTASGERSAALARALVPTPESKAETWARLTGDEKLPNWLQRSLLQGFHHPSQLSLTLEYREKFFEIVDEIWASRDSETAQEFVLFAYPSVHVSEDTVAMTDAWLAVDGHPAPLRRLVAEGRDGVVRALKARARDAQAA